MISESAGVSSAWRLLGRDGPDLDAPLGATGEASPLGEGELDLRASGRKERRRNDRRYRCQALVPVSGWTMVGSAAPPCPGRRLRAASRSALVLRPPADPAASDPSAWGRSAGCLGSRPGSCVRPGRSGQPRKGGRLHLLVLPLVQAGQVGPAEPFPVRLGGRPAAVVPGSGRVEPPACEPGGAAAGWSAPLVGATGAGCRPGWAGGAGGAGVGSPAQYRDAPGDVPHRLRQAAGGAAAPPVTRAPTRATAASPAQRRRGGRAARRGPGGGSAGPGHGRSSARAAARPASSSGVGSAAAAASSAATLA